jgi:hypothetical protein
MSPAQRAEFRAAAGRCRHCPGQFLRQTRTMDSSIDAASDKVKRCSHDCVENGAAGGETRTTATDARRARRCDALSLPGTAGQFGWHRSEQPLQEATRAPTHPRQLAPHQGLNLQITSMYLRWHHIEPLTDLVLLPGDPSCLTLALRQLAQTCVRTVHAQPKVRIGSKCADRMPSKNRGQVHIRLPSIRSTGGL